jgi:hypothetical protein
MTDTVGSPDDVPESSDVMFYEHIEIPVGADQESQDALVRLLLEVARAAAARGSGDDLFRELADAVPPVWWAGTARDLVNAVRRGYGEHTARQVARYYGDRQHDGELGILVYRLNLAAHAQRARSWDGYRIRSGYRAVRARVARSYRTAGWQLGMRIVAIGSGGSWTVYSAATGRWGAISVVEVAVLVLALAGVAATVAQNRGSRLAR